MGKLGKSCSTDMSDPYEKGKWSKKIMPKVAEKTTIMSQNLNTFEKKTIAQLILGHFPLNEYLERFGLTTDPRCRHCNEMETIPHFLTECKRLEGIRMKAATQWGYFERNEISLLKEPKFFQAICEMARVRLGRKWEEL